MADLDIAALNNPIWNALTTGHRDKALTHGLAARYPRAISSLVGIGEPTPRAFADLHTLVEPGETVATFNTVLLEVPPGWKVHTQRFIDQMVCEDIPREKPERPLVLTPKDVPEMAALVALTEPGPFSTRTIEMGHYYGVRSEDGRLASMAGQRLGAASFTEISAVCTHPDFRGRGLSRTLLTWLIREVAETGKLPILHVKTENGAKVLYEKLGYRIRTPIQLTVISKQGA